MIARAGSRANSYYWAVVLLAAALLLASVCLSRFSPTVFTVSFLDVGQGDATLLSRGEDQILVDAGPDRSVLAGLGRQMPFYDRTIELAVLTHPHADHYAGFSEVLKRYRVLAIVLPESGSKAADYKALLTAIGESGTAVTIIRCGDSYLTGGMRIEALHPCVPAKPGGDVNEDSLVLRATGPDGGTALLTGDAPGAILEAESGAESGLWRADILKVPHHGSRFGATADFLAEVQPNFAVIPVGRNYYGHPSSAVLQRLRDARITTCRTDVSGAVTFVRTDGAWSLRTEDGPCLAVSGK